MQLLFFLLMLCSMAQISAMEQSITELKIYNGCSQFCLKVGAQEAISLEVIDDPAVLKDMCSKYVWGEYKNHMGHVALIYYMNRKPGYKNGNYEQRLLEYVCTILIQCGIKYVAVQAKIRDDDVNIYTEHQLWLEHNKKLKEVLEICGFTLTAPYCVGGCLNGEFWHKEL